LGKINALLNISTRKIIWEYYIVREDDDVAQKPHKNYNLNVAMVMVTALLWTIFAIGQVFAADPFAFPDRCTAMAVGRLATTDGSTMTTHTADW